MESRFNKAASWLAALAGLLLILLVFSPAFRGAPVLDDHTIATNPYLKSLSHIPHLLSSTTLESGQVEAPPNMYRPLLLLSWMGDILLFGQLNWISHLINLLLHWLNAVLLFLLLSRFMAKRSLALAAAILFALHPATVEPVVWIAGRPELLAACFMLASLWLQLSANKAKLWLAIVCYCMALLSKESAIYLPLIVVIADWALGLPFKKMEQSRLLKYGLFVGASCIYLILRYQVIDPSLDPVPGYFPKLTHWLNVMGQALLVMSLYLPLELTRLYTVSGAAVALAILYCGGVLFVFSYRKLRDECRGMAIGVGFFIIPLGIIALFVPISGLLADRYFYLPLLGVIFFLFCLLGHWWPRFSQNKLRLATAVLVGLSLFFAAKSYQQSRVWQSEVGLYELALSKNPDNYYAHYFLARLHERNGDVGKAISAYKKVIGIRPDSMIAIKNLSLVLIKKEKYTEAENLITRALVNFPQDPGLLFMAGEVQLKLGHFKECLFMYSRALSANPNLEGGFTRLAACAKGVGIIEPGQENFSQGSLDKPQDFPLWTWLARAMLAGKHYKEAASALEQALMFKPRDHQVLLTLVQLYNGPLNNIERGCVHLQRLLAIPNLPVDYEKISSLTYRCPKTP